MSLGDLYTLELLVLIVSAVFWFRVAVVEDVSPWLWAAMSVIISVLCWKGLHWGFGGMLLGQCSLFVFVGVWRAWKAIDEQRRG
jgi:hypothetical protein